MAKKEILDLATSLGWMLRRKELDGQFTWTKKMAEKKIKKHPGLCLKGDFSTYTCSCPIKTGRDGEIAA